LLNLISCDKNEEVLKSEDIKNEFTSNEVGKYHNLALEKVEARFQKLIDIQLKSKSSKIMYSSEYFNRIESEEISEFVNSTEPELGVTESEVLSAVTTTNNLVEQYPNVVSRNLIKINDAKSKLNDLANLNKISIFEKNLIIKLLDLTYQCDSTVDYSTFQTKLEELKVNMLPIVGKEIMVK
jgi:hypothetical protein